MKQLTCSYRTIRFDFALKYPIERRIWVVREPKFEDQSCFGARGAKMADMLSVCCSGTVEGVPAELLADREGH